MYNLLLYENRHLSTRRTMKKNTQAILETLEREYGTEYVCYLNHENALQLLVATMLSAQCTDARVNIVTESLFQKYLTAEDFANADLKELEQEIRSTGFYRNKAKNIKSCSIDICEKFNGKERHNALKRFNELCKQYPHAEQIKKIEKSQWE